MQFFTAASVLAALASSACSAATIEDYPWLGEGSCDNANGDWYDSYYVSMDPATNFDHDCIEWCLQNSEGLRGVTVYRDGASMFCYALYDNSPPNGLVFSPAHTGINFDGVATGVITQVGASANRVCYAPPLPAPPKCGPEGQFVKVQSNTGEPLQMREVRVFSNDVNVAIGKNATQSDDLEDSTTADKAVDNKWRTWSSTNTTGCQWWQVDLNATYSIDKIIIVNTKNLDSCKLSYATVSVLDENGTWVEATTTRDTCDKGWVVPRLPKSECP